MMTESADSTTGARIDSYAFPPDPDDEPPRQGPVTDSRSGRLDFRAAYGGASEKTQYIDPNAQREKTEYIAPVPSRDDRPTDEIPVVTDDTLPHTDEAADSGLRVRPYARTGGRTRSDIDLAIETIVSTNERSMNSAMMSTREHHIISRLCLQPHSVAEVSAKLRLPLGVVRILLSDMSSLSLIEVHHNTEIHGSRPSMEMMERVLAGLRRI